MFPCFHCAIEIVILSRSPEARDANEFVTLWSYLGEYLKRVNELQKKYPDLLNKWPRSPGITFSCEAGWSALDVALKFSWMIFDATIYASAVALGCGHPYLHFLTNNGQRFTPQHEGCEQERLHEVTTSGGEAQKWRDLTIQRLRTVTLPTVSEWPMWQVLRDVGSLTERLEDEFLQATGKPAEPGQAEADEKTSTALRRAERLAYESNEFALSENPNLAGATDDKVYVWLKENGAPEEYELPSCQTWKRQVRAARKYHGTQKNTPRAGRDGRSTIKSDQIQSLSEISSQYENEAD